MSLEMLNGNRFTGYENGNWFYQFSKQVLCFTIILPIENCNNDDKECCL